VTVRSRPASPIATQGLPVERQQAGDAAGLDDQHHGRTVRTMRPRVRSRPRRRSIFRACRSNRNEPATRPGSMTSTTGAPGAPCAHVSAAGPGDGGREVVTVRSRPASPIGTQGLPIEREQAGDGGRAR
jgi:hypothetical protein